MSSRSSSSSSGGNINRKIKITTVEAQETAVTEVVLLVVRFAGIVSPVELRSKCGSSLSKL